MVNIVNFVGKCDEHDFFFFSEMSDLYLVFLERYIVTLLNFKEMEREFLNVLSERKKNVVNAFIVAL